MTLLDRLFPSYRDPFSLLASSNAMAAGYAQGLQAGLAMSSPYAMPNGYDQGLDLALARFLLGGAGGNAGVAGDPALAFAMQSMLQQMNMRGMLGGYDPSAPGGFNQGMPGMPGMSGMQPGMAEAALMIELIAMAMLAGARMNGCGCRAHQGTLGSNGAWGGGRPVDGWGPGGGVKGGPSLPPGDIPAGTSVGNHLAHTAAGVAGSMGTVGWCYRGAKESIRRATGVSLQGGSAYMAADQLAGSGRFREIGVSPDQLRNLPPGAVVVWGRTERSPHGHISVSLGNGREASDHIQRQMTSLRGYTNFRVFIPNSGTAYA